MKKESLQNSKIKINLSESEIKVISLKSNEVLYSFNSSDVRGLFFLAGDPKDYLLELISSDSTIDEVIDTLESVKDDVKELYRENPNLINYYTGEGLPSTEENFSDDRPLRNKGRVNQPIWKQTWFIVVAVLIVLFFIPLRHNIRCSIQGGEIRDYRPTYQVVSTGKTFGGSSIESVCVKKTSTGYQTLFEIR